jgi:hypothetical protein
MWVHRHRVTIAETDGDVTGETLGHSTIEAALIWCLRVVQARTSRVAVWRVGFGAKIKLIRLILVLRQIFEIVARTPKIFYFTHIAINIHSR